MIKPINSLLIQSSPTFMSNSESNVHAFANHHPLTVFFLPDTNQMRRNLFPFLNELKQELVMYSLKTRFIANKYKQKGTSELPRFHPTAFLL